MTNKRGNIFPKVWRISRMTLLDLAYNAKAQVVWQSVRHFNGLKIVCIVVTNPYHDGSVTYHREVLIRYNHKWYGATGDTWKTAYSFAESFARAGNYAYDLEPKSVAELNAL